MGGTSSKTSVESIIDAGTSVINNISQTCVQTLSETEALNIDGCTNVLYNNINFSQFGTVKSGCQAQQAADSTVQADISEAIQNAAMTAQDTLIPKADTTTAEAYSKAVTDISSAVINAFSEDCSVDTLLNEVTTCHDSQGVEVLNVKFQQFGQATVDCVQNATAVGSASTHLQDVIDNSAAASATDPFADLIKGITNPFFLFGALIVAGLFILAPLFGGEVIVVDMVKSPYFWAAVVVLVALFVWFETRSSSSSSDDDNDTGNG